MPEKCSCEQEVKELAVKVAKIESDLKTVWKKTEEHKGMQETLFDLITEVRVMNEGQRHVIKSQERLEKSVENMDKRVDKLEVSMMESLNLTKQTASLEVEKAELELKKQLNAQSERIKNLEDAPANEYKRMKIKVKDQIIAAVIGGMITVIGGIIMLFIAFPPSA